MKLAYIIPVHKEDNKLVERALASLEKQTLPPAMVVIVGKVETARKHFSVNEPGTVSFTDTNGCKYSFVAVEYTTYPELVNFGLQYISNEDSEIDWVSILEYDDELNETATKIFSDYQTQFPNVEVFAGLTFIVSDEEGPQKGAIVGCGNESVWAPNISEEEGYFDYNQLIRANYLFINGSFIKRSVFDEVGIMKPKIKHFYDYEFALRLVYQGKICRAIPKITHLHYSSFVGDTSIGKIAKLSEKERTFWMMTAKKEYFYQSDEERTITYKEA